MDNELVYLKAMLACGNAIESFREKCPMAFDYEFTSLRGQNLSADFTIGAWMAAFRAAVEALAFQPEGFDANLEKEEWWERTGDIKRVFKW